jgi:hypothetical protein
MPHCKSAASSTPNESVVEMTRIQQNKALIWIKDGVQKIPILVDEIRV